MAITASKVRKYTSNLAIAIYNYGMTKWHDAVDPALEAIDSAFGEDRTRLAAIETYLETHSNFTADNPLDTLGLTQSLGNINAPVLSLNLKSVAEARAFSEEFRFLCESDVTYWDRYGVLQRLSYYSGTPTSASNISVTDTGQSWSADALLDYVVYLTDGTNEAYRWVDGNSATSLVFQKPVAFTPTSYKLSKPRFDASGLIEEGDGQNSCLDPEGLSTANWTAGGGLTFGTPVVAAGVTLDLLQDANASGGSYNLQDITVPDDSDTHSAIVLIKQFGTDNLSRVRVGLTGGTTTLFDNYDFDFSTETLSHSTVSGAGNFLGFKARADGVYELRFNVMNNATGNTTIRISLLPAVQNDYNTDTGSCYFGGVQVQLSRPVPGSYIPATTTAAPRSATYFSVKAEGYIPKAGDNYTVRVRFTCDSYILFNGLWGVFDGSSATTRLAIHTNGLVKFWSGALDVCTSTTVVTDELEHSVSVSVIDGVAFLYVDGIPEDFGTASDSYATPQELRIGRSYGAGEVSMLYGNNSAVDVWDFGLTAAEHRMVA